MNYNLMSKETVIQKLKEAHAQLDEFKHLKSAVESKDKEVSDSYTKNANEIQALKTNHQEELKILKTKHQEELKAQEEYLNKEHATISEQTNKEIMISHDEIKKLTEINYDLQKTNYQKLHKLFFQYGALLKTLQGSIDTHIDMNDLLYQKFIEKGE